LECYLHSSDRRYKSDPGAGQEAVRVLGVEQHDVEGAGRSHEVQRRQVEVGVPVYHTGRRGLLRHGDFSEALAEVAVRGLAGVGTEEDLQEVTVTASFV